ncbi:hypothetical protein [Actinacidiphila oryziradicis]|uniref:Secreted protein n=1 Tax=Actinacidiphila oryziradicis TaxID=2571141 RepID=A0A4U0S205_9ACTN|nr:hypothetical protein [Actinacidiphila oryziradicis]TKA02894.1 hypothetical protein FCI23_38290 [Actinacidiphila oryziradicis]
MITKRRAFGAMSLAVAMAGLIATSASAAQAVPNSPTAKQSIASASVSSKQLSPAALTEQRCWYFSPGTNANRLCVQIVTDSWGNWTGVRTTYYKTTPGTISVQLGWEHTDGSSGNATGWYNITGPTSTSHEWDGVTPRGCIIGTMNVAGQGHFDTYLGTPGNGVFCS